MFYISFANLKSASSKGGFMIFPYGSDKYAPIAWKSNKFKKVVKSALSAENTSS